MFLIENEIGPSTPAAVAQSVKRFEWLIGFLICRFHFVHHILGHMWKQPQPGMGTMGVYIGDIGRINLTYDPVWFNALTDAEGTYILYHEVLHVVLHHCTCRQRIEDHENWNVAIDLAVNELIKEVPGVCDRPRNKKGELVGCHVSELKKKAEYADIEEKQSAEWYYDYLKRKAQQQPQQPQGSGQGQPQQQQPGQGNGGFDDHKGFKEHEIAEERIRSLIREIDRNNQWGNLDGVDKELILAAQVKRINWRNLIRTRVGNVMWKLKEGTRKRPNRRMGWSYPGSRRRYEDRGLICWDDSGSVDSELLAEFAGVTNQLAEDYPIDMMTFDHKVQDMPVPYDRRKAKVELHGRGGTNFQPVIDLINERKYLWAMILTDGGAPAPTKPTIANIIWVLPKGLNPPVDWGTKVHMEKRA